MKNKWVSFILCLFLGTFGAHKFYEGKIGMGILYLFTVGLLGVGWLVDLISILRKPALYDPMAGKQQAPRAAAPTRTVPPPAPATPARPVIVPPTAVPVARPPQKKPAVSVPRNKDGATLAYQYSLSLSSIDKDVALRAANSDRRYLSVEMRDGQAYVLFEGVVLGLLTERTDMLGDWIRRGDPYLMVLEQTDAGGNCVIKLAFYRDKLKQYASREQSVVALTGYKSAEKQENISPLEKDEELSAEEDMDHEGRVVISSDFGPIGNLPKKYADRYLEEDAALIVFDHDEEDDDFKVKPFVRIYW